MREESLKYGTSKKKELANREDETEAVITTLEKRLPEFNGDETQRGKSVSEL